MGVRVRVLLMRDVVVAQAWLDQLAGKPVTLGRGAEAPVCGTVRRAWRVSQDGREEVWADLDLDDTAAKATTEQAAELLPIRGVKQ